jgi:hypothetical protein
MVKHIVMWKLKDEAEGVGKAENARRMKKLLESLFSKIDEIQLIEVGLSDSAQADAYDIVLYSEFAGWNDLKAYQVHPEHIKVAEFVKKIRLDRKVVDYEI